MTHSDGGPPVPANTTEPNTTAHAQEVPVMSDGGERSSTTILKLREFGKNWDSPGNFVLLLLEFLSSSYADALRSLFLLIFCVLLPLKLDGFLTSSWILVSFPLFVIAFLQFIEIPAFILYWCYITQYEVALKQGRESFLWPRGWKVNEFSPDSSQFSYALGNTHSAEWLKTVCCAQFFKHYGPFLKISQVLSGVTFFLLLPFVLQGSVPELVRLILPFLFLWYGLFLVWSFHEYAVRAYYDCQSKTHIGYARAFGLTYSLCTLTLISWMFIWAFNGNSYWLGTIPCWIACSIMFCFPCWICCNRNEIETSPEYYGPISMDDPGNVNECLYSMFVLYFFVCPFYVCAVIFLTLKLSSAITWLWTISFIPLWLILGVYAFTGIPKFAFREIDRV